MKASKALSILLVIAAVAIWLHQVLLYGQIFSIADVGDFFASSFQNMHHEILIIFSLIAAFIVYKISDDFTKW